MMYRKCRFVYAVDEVRSTKCEREFSYAGKPPNPSDYQSVIFSKLREGNWHTEMPIFGAISSTISQIVHRLKIPIWLVELVFPGQNHRLQFVANSMCWITQYWTNPRMGTRTPSPSISNLNHSHGFWHGIPNIIWHFMEMPSISKIQTRSSLIKLKFIDRQKKLL
jgi:hypothetical protein